MKTTRIVTAVFCITTVAITGCAKKFTPEEIAAAKAKAASLAEQYSDTIQGGGVEFSNQVFEGAEGSSGEFENGEEIIDLASGIVLTTGELALIYQPESVKSGGGSGEESFDEELKSITTQEHIYDASTLEFDIKIAANMHYLKVSYVFASEEYPAYVNSEYNDVFGFWVSGDDPNSGTDYDSVNIALVPGTEDVVSVNTINADENSEYYVSNSGGQDIVFGGFTKPMEAVIAVTPGQTYHLKVAIADASDNDYDSAVFVSTVQAVASID